jgi:hypothetical protein
MKMNKNEEVEVEYWKNGNKKTEMPKGSYGYWDKGEHKTWYENGVLESVRIGKNGLTDRKDYWDNGNLKLEGQFDVDKPAGRLRTYHKNGNRKSVETYNSKRTQPIDVHKKQFCKKTYCKGILGFFDVKGKNTYNTFSNILNPDDLPKEDLQEFRSWTNEGKGK